MFNENSNLFHYKSNFFKTLKMKGRDTFTEREFSRNMEAFILENEILDFGHDYACMTHLFVSKFSKKRANN